MNVNLSYNSPSSWSIQFKSGGCPSQFSSLKNFRSLVVPGGGCHKGRNIQVVLVTMGVPPNRQSLLRIKVDVTIASVHAPIQRNIPYGHTVRQSIYKTRQPKNPQLPICLSTTTPRDQLSGGNGGSDKSLIRKNDIK